MTSSQKSKIEPHHSAEYSFDIVQEIALAMKKFIETGLTSTEAQAAAQAYAVIRSAEIMAASEAQQRSYDRTSSEEGSYYHRKGRYIPRI